MAELRYPRAALYREWHHKRWAAWVLFLLTGPSVFLQTLFTAHDSRVLNFSDFCSQVIGKYTTGEWASLVIIVFALYSMWIERYGDTYWFTFGGPISKRALLRVKYTVDVATIVGVYTVLACCLVIIDAVVGAHYPVLGIVRWWFAENSILLGMYGLAFVLSVAMGNLIGAGLVAFGVATAPMYIGALLVNWLGANLIYFDGYTSTMIPFSWKLMWIFSHLTPLNWYSARFVATWGHPVLFFTWFLIGSLLCYALAQALFARTANERFSNLFVFRETRHIITLLLSGVVSFVIVMLILHGTPMTHAHELSWYFAITVVLWLLFTFTRHPWSKTR